MKFKIVLINFPYDDFSGLIKAFFQKIIGVLPISYCNVVDEKLKLIFNISQ